MINTFTIDRIAINKINYDHLLYGYKSTRTLIGCWVGIIFL